MVFIEWGPNLSVDVPAIDQEHHQLVDLVNQLHQAMVTGKASSVLGSIFQRLIEYTDFHFKSEETLMKESRYPDAEAHFKEHRELLDQAVELQAQFQQGKLMISISLLEFLKNWLANHIQSTDRRLGTFLKNR